MRLRSRKPRGGREREREICLKCRVHTLTHE
jgi:hypothetical protein